MEKFEWVYDIFAFIGISVCIIIALIAIVWATCFAVKLLIKVFNVRVGKTYDVMVEDITKKSELKKERNEIKRTEKEKQKKELLNMKLESKQRIFEMKKQKLEENLKQKEENAKAKIFGAEMAENEPATLEYVAENEQEKEESKTEKKTKSKKSKSEE